MAFKSFARLAALGVFLVISFAGAAWADSLFQWTQERAVELHVNGQPYAASFTHGRVNPVYRAGPFGEQPYVLYSIELLPGLDYTLGLSYPSGQRHLRATLFDRWPFAPGARRFDLPGGPLARAAGRIEYRWRVGISSKSTSPLLYVALRPEGGLEKPLPYTVYLATPPVDPRELPGGGITYLNGPSDMFLACDQPKVMAYVVEKPAPAIDPAGLTLPIIGDLVENGWFRDGLNHWTPHRNYEPAGDVGTVALLDEGLRIRSESTTAREGVMQTIDEAVEDADSLILRADVKVERQSAGGTGLDGRSAPAALAVCYEDEAGEERCNSNLFWTGFFSLAPVNPLEAKDGQKVPAGLWYRYMADLMQLDPKPRRIRFISIEGSGLPAREAWIRDIHMVKRKKKDAAGQKQ